jgi:molybdate transport system permease protein
MSDGALAALALSAKVALVATVAVFPLGACLGWLLARRAVPGKAVLETLTALPLVLPPTAVGYLLLRLLARDGPLGERALGVDLDLLVVRTARIAFEEVDPRLEGLARTLGLGPARTLLEVTLPLARRGLLAAAVLGFTRALGEFGATVVVAGNIPGKTQTLALAIFTDIQLGHDDEATTLVAITVALAFAALWTVEALLRRGRRR